MKTKPNHVQEFNHKIEQQLYEAIVAIRTVEEAEMFFNDLCTPAERQAMADRWAVVEPLLEGIPYRTISENTGISVTTIGRVARCLLSGEGGYATIIERLNKKRQAFKRKNA